MRGYSARLVVTALAVGVYAVIVDDTRASVMVAGIGCLMFDGFLVNRQGELSWDGKFSMLCLMVTSTALALGLALQWIRAIRADGKRVRRKAIKPINKPSQARKRHTVPDLIFVVLTVGLRAGSRPHRELI